MKNIKKLSADTLFDEMNKCNRTGNHRTAVIVYSSSNWPDENYSETERSYESNSDQWGWDYSKMGRRRTGTCIDGVDVNIRLDYYDWKVDYWYWKDEA